MNIPGLGTTEKVDRVDSGEGRVYEHTLEVGESVVVFRNIGTIALVNGSNNPWPIILGGFLVLASLPLLAISRGLGLLLLLGGVALIVWGFVRPPDIFLSIGACDGRRTNIVSKDRSFLLRVRSALRFKIENASETGTINITARTITGGIALGANSSASGGHDPKPEPSP